MSDEWMGAVCLVQLAPRQVLVDAEDLDRVCAHRWQAQRTSSKARGEYWYIRHRAKGKWVWLHRVVTGAGDQGLVVDHLNGDRFDNRKANLRISTHTMNMANMKLRADNTTGFRGVCPNKHRRKWVAKIRVLGKRVNLGSYSTPQEASLVFEAAAAERDKLFAADIAARIGA